MVLSIECVLSPQVSGLRIECAPSIECVLSPQGSGLRPQVSGTRHRRIECGSLYRMCSLSSGLRSQVPGISHLVDLPTD